MSCKLAATLSFLLACAHSQGLPEDADFSWEDFDSAVSEEDCFGSQCGEASAALSLIQRQASMVNHKTIHQRYPEAEAANTISMDELSDAFEKEDVSDVAALSLVQTGASVERAPLPHAHMAGAVAADGTIEINPHAPSALSNGAVAFSVDAHGGLHAEEVTSLLQTETRVKSHRSGEKDLKTSEPDMPKEFEHPSWSSEAMSEGSLSEEGVFDGKENALSLLQIDAELEKSGASLHQSGSVNADGSFEMNPKKTAIPGDGVMHLSVDATGHFHMEM